MKMKTAGAWKQKSNMISNPMCPRARQWGGKRGGSSCNQYRAQGIEMQ